jgi:hypothetical protein
MTDIRYKEWHQVAFERVMDLIATFMSVPRIVLARMSREALAFSAICPHRGVHLSDLGGQSPHSVLTAATPIAEGNCGVRLSLILPASEDGKPPIERCKHPLQHSRIGLEKDRQIYAPRSGLLRGTPPW